MAAIEDMKAAVESMKTTLSALATDAAEADRALISASARLSALRARITIASEEAEGRPQSRAARLARCLIAERYDDAEYQRILAEPADTADALRSSPAMR